MLKLVQWPTILLFQYQGSLVVAPIITPQGQVVGVVNVDSISSRSLQQFENHEVSFYQVHGQN